MANFTPRLFQIYQMHEIYLSMLFINHKLSRLKTEGSLDQFRRIDAAIQDILPKEMNTSTDYALLYTQLASFLMENNFNTEFSAFLAVQEPPGPEKGNLFKHSHSLTALQSNCSLPLEQSPQSAQILSALFIVYNYCGGEWGSVSLAADILFSLTDIPDLEQNILKWEKILASLNAPIKENSLNQKIDDTLQVLKIRLAITQSFINSMHTHSQSAPKSDVQQPRAPKVRGRSTSKLTATPREPSSNIAAFFSSSLPQPGKTSSQSFFSQPSLTEEFFSSPLPLPQPTTTTPLVEFHYFYQEIRDMLTEQRAPDHALMTQENAKNFYTYLIAHEKELLRKNSFDLVGIFFYYIDHYESAPSLSGPQ